MNAPVLHQLLLAGLPVAHEAVAAAALPAGRCVRVDGVPQALATLRDGTPWQLLLLAADVPGGGAEAVLCALAAPGSPPPCPVLVLCAGEPPDAQSDAWLRAGAQDVLDGGAALTPPVLARAARHAMARWARGRELLAGGDEARAALEASRLKLAMGIQAAGLVMAEIDYRTNQNHLSAELARLLELGDGPMTVPRQAVFDRIHPDDRARYLAGIASTVDPAGGGHLAIDVRLLLPSGTVRWLHIRLQVTFTRVEGQLRPDRGICAARDATAEILAGRQMRAAQRLAESVIEGAGALVFAKDLAGRYVLSNQAWRDQFNVTPEQARGLTDEVLFGRETAAQLRANDLEVVRSGRALVAEESGTIAGRRVTYRSSKFPLYDEAGQVWAVCGVSTDITDVVEADRRKDEFLATLAHELRNPLAPIRNGLEILRRGADLPPAAVRVRDLMERQLTHLVRLVDDLLDVSRISRDKLEMRRSRVALSQLLDHALEASRPAIDAAGHTLTLHLPPEPVWVQGDAVRLAQVLGNLLNNAAKYTPAGGDIRVAAQVAQAQLVIAVSDNGVGIACDMLPRVFDLFTQVNRTLDRAQGGLGIGLWLVRKLVELHGGTVEAESGGVGRGSCFTVRLPLA